MPFGHGLGEGPMVRNFVRSGPGYTLSQNPLENTLQAEVHNARSTEPVLGIGSAAALVPVIVLGIVQLLAPDWTELTATLFAFFTPIIVALVTRGKVWSPASVKEVLDIAILEAEKTRKK